MRAPGVLLRRGAAAAAGAAAVLAALIALAWLSAQLTRLEDAEALARREAAREQATTLALWRMDLSLARLVTEEGLRAGAPEASWRRARPAPEVVLHFTVDSLGRLASPEVGWGEVPPARLTELDAALCGSPLWPAVRTQAAARELASTPQQRLVTKSARPGPKLLAQEPAGQADAQAVDEQLRNAFARQNAAVAQQLAAPGAPAPPPVAAGETVEGEVTPVWRGGLLLLVRRDRSPGGALLAGTWLRWEAVRGELLAGIRDLLPAARLEPVPEPGARPPRMLASLPVRLEPGEPAALPAGSRSARRGLWVAWLALGTAAAALAALALGAVALAGRKATFASAVTHELRTPLTTFRVYAEMLEGGLVPEGQVPSYLATLRSEADRLSHLVENVLAWSRLERGRFGRLRERVEVDVLLARDVPRLAERAKQAGMVLALEVGEGGLALQGEATAVGQILFNLVDNACKHAGAATDRRVTLSVRAEGKAVLLAVQDRGPGVTKRSARRLFRAFGRPAAEAALSAPGVGLGLPLSRRLAREMGGALDLAGDGPSGATFVLRLPRL